jgi:hypothetical protein
MTKRPSRNVVASAVGMVVGLWVGLSAPALAGAADGSPPVVLGARASPEMTILTLRGRHLGDALPRVRLGERWLQVLTGSDGSVQARLPAGTSPGRYAVVIVRADGATARAELEVRPAAGGAAAAKVPAPTGKPVLDGASAEPEMAVVTIQGRNLGGDLPVVTLAGKPLRTLTSDGTTVVARLPAKTPPGKYLLAVRRSDGATASLQASLGR